MEYCLEALSDNHSIQLLAPPSSLLLHIHDVCRQILLVHAKKETTSAVQSRDSTPVKRDNTIISEADLTGSPLKLDLAYDMLEETLLMDVTMNWSKDDFNLSPITLEEARNILNKYNEKIRSIEYEDRMPLWIVCNGEDANQTILMGALSYKDHFNRAVVNYIETLTSSQLSVDKMKSIHLKTYGCNNDSEPKCKITGIYKIAGRRPNNLINTDEIFQKHYTGMTQLECSWTKPTLQIPFHEASIQLIQEVIIGHELNGSTLLWKSVCALQGVNNAIMNLTSTLMPSNLSSTSIRAFEIPWSYPSQDELELKLKKLLLEVEEYSGLPMGPKGGYVCISDDSTSLQQVFNTMSKVGSSNDFTYKLWDILKDADNVENLINLLSYALKGIYSKNLRPFIDPSNTTFFASLVKKIARGVSTQAINSLNTLYSNPIRALSIIGQLGINKTVWEYTNLFSLLDNTLAFNDRLKLINKVSESGEKMMNETLLDMTIGSGNMSINPFDTKLNLMDSTFMQDMDSPSSDKMVDFNLDNFASLKKLKGSDGFAEKPAEKEVPLFPEDMDVELSSKEWKHKLMRFTQLQASLDHAYKTQQSLNIDFNSLKPIVSQLIEHFTADNSPIKTVGQLRCEPIQSFTFPVQYKTVKDHLQFKNASIYKIMFTSESYNEDKTLKEVNEPYQTMISTFVCSQQPLFPPSMFIPKDLPENDESIFYHCTRYLFISNMI